MKSQTKQHSRRGAIVVLTAFLMIFMMGMIALSIDTGMILVTRTQLQAAADSSAMAAAAVLGSSGSGRGSHSEAICALHKAGGAAISLASSDIEYGTWDSTVRQFSHLTVQPWEMP